MDDQSETAQFREQCLEHLDDVLRKVEEFGNGVYVLDDEHLATLNIRRAELLDIEERTVDFGPRFFYPRFTLDQARQKTAEYFADHEEEREECVWPKRCRRGSSNEDGFWWETPSTAPQDPEGSEWQFWPGELLAGNLPGYYEHQAQIGGIQQEYSFYVNHACWITDDAVELPHMGGTVIDSAESEDEEVLRSEVVAAIALLKLQLRRGHFYHHHTLPAIVFSFQHDRFGRVTQFHFDGRSLVLRPSRLLDFRSDEAYARCISHVTLDGQPPNGRDEGPETR